MVTGAPAAPLLMAGSLLSRTWAAEPAGSRRAGKSSRM